MGSIRRLAVVLAIVAALGSAGVAGAADTFLGRMVQKRRAEYRLHKELGAGPLTAAIPGNAAIRGAVLQQKVGNRMRQRLQKKREVPAIQSTPSSSR